MKNYPVLFSFVLEVHSGPYVYHRRVIWTGIALICSIHISYFSLWLREKYTENYSSEYNKNYHHHQSWLIVDHYSYLIFLRFFTWFNKKLSCIVFMIIYLSVLYLCRPYTASLFMHAPLLPKHIEFQIQFLTINIFFTLTDHQIYFLINLFIIIYSYTYIPKTSEFFFAY